MSWPTSGQTDSIQEIAEAGLRAKGVGHRLHPIVDQTIVAFLVSLFEPRQGCVFLTETGINRGKVKRRDLTGTGELLKLGERFTRASGIAGDGECVTVRHQHGGGIAGLFANFIEFGDSVRVHLLFSVRRG